MAYKRKYRSRPYKKSRRGKYGRRARRQTFKQRVKRIVMKAAETKYTTIGFENVALWHDVGNLAGPRTEQAAIFFNPWSYVSQGTLSKNRIGDIVMPRGIAINLWLANKLDRPNLMYRVMVVVLPRSIQGTVPTYNNVDLFKAVDNGVNNSTLMAEVDKEKVLKVLYDKVIRNEAGVSAISTGTQAVPSANFRGAEKHALIKIWIKAKKQKNIQYINNTNEHRNNFLSLYVIPYDSFGTLQTDNVASCSWNAKLYWKDF